MNKMMIFLKTYSFTLVFMMVMCIPIIAGADVNPFDKAGITTNQETDLYTSLKKVITYIQYIGGFWAIACLVFAGIMLAGAGGNPQKRTGGFYAIGFALLGAFVVMKASTIAGWVLALQTTTP